MKEMDVFSSFDFVRRDFLVGTEALDLGIWDL